MFDFAKLEVYCNGDQTLTEFKMSCYKRSNSYWEYVGMYTLDFLIIQRKNGVTNRAIIVDTQGVIYDNDSTFKDKKAFVESTFLHKNNETFKYNRFEYLYLEASEAEHARINKTASVLENFFKGV